MFDSKRGSRCGRQFKRGKLVNGSFAPSGLDLVVVRTHGLRRGLYYCAASRLFDLLELVVGVYIESKNSVDLNWLISAQGGTELPSVKRGQHLAGHHRGGGFEHLRLA